MPYEEQNIDPSVCRQQMLRMIEEFDYQPFTPRVQELYQKAFARIRRNIADSRYVAYDSVGDVLLKDYALCRGILFPAEAQVVDQGCGFSRSLMFKGVSQGISVLNILRKTGGHDGFYQIHTHLEDLQHFSPEGFERCYVIVAEMLKLHPKVRGMYGGSWFYDPALKQVSPHLAYLRELPEANGANFFFQDVSVDTGALEKSKTRQRLYEQGEYLPRRYAMVWPRRDLMRWARV